MNIDNGINNGIDVLFSLTSNMIINNNSNIHIINTFETVKCLHSLCMKNLNESCTDDIIEQKEKVNIAILNAYRNVSCDIDNILMSLIQINYYMILIYNYIDIMYNNDTTNNIVEHINELMYFERTISLYDIHICEYNIMYGQSLLYNNLVEIITHVRQIYKNINSRIYKKIDALKRDYIEYYENINNSIYRSKQEFVDKCVNIIDEDTILDIENDMRINLDRANNNLIDAIDSICILETILNILKP